MHGHELRRVESFRRFARDPNGNITQSLREDGSCWYYDYDGLQRLTAADWKDAGGSTLYAFEYEYDKVGNRLRFAQNGVSTYYSYNEANELVSEVTPGSETAYYAFDGRGNQIRRSVLAGHTTYFSYNSRNLVSGIWNTDPTSTPNYFTYNALGQRIKKVDSTGTTRYLWDGLNILLETDPSGNLTRRYTHGYARIEGVSSFIAVEGPMQCPCFYHFDQVGGVRHLTDPYHNTIKSYAFEPFGRLLAEAGSAPNDFAFPATYIQLSELPTLRLSPTRGYDARTGRFSQRDPHQNPAVPWRFEVPNFPSPQNLAEEEVEVLFPIRRLPRRMGDRFDAGALTSLVIDTATQWAPRLALAAQWIPGTYCYCANCPTGVVDPAGLVESVRELPGGKFRIRWGTSPGAKVEHLDIEVPAGKRWTRIAAICADGTPHDNLTLAPLSRKQAEQIQEHLPTGVKRLFGAFFAISIVLSILGVANMAKCESEWRSAKNDLNEFAKTKRCTPEGGMVLASLGAYFCCAIADQTAQGAALRSAQFAIYAGCI
jgi:YD repeat-containing protein